MRVVSVDYNGFEKVYSVYRRSHGTGKNLDQILNHVEVNIRMDSLTMMEAFFMKMIFGSGVTDLGASIIESDDDYQRIFPEESFPDMKPSLKSVVDMLPTLDTDDDVKTKPGPMVLPSGMISREILIKITGKPIMILFEQGFGPVWNSLFTGPDGTTIPENSRPDSLDLTNNDIKQRLDNICIQGVITQLYNTMNDTLTSIDREVDAYIYDNYYKYMEHNLDCSIAEIDTPVGQVSFFGTEDANNQLASIKEKLNSDESKKYLLTGTTRIAFTVKSSIYAFIELILGLPAGFIIDHSDLNINLASDEVFVSRDLTKYKTRIINKMKIFNAIKVELSKSKEFPIGKYNFILLNSPITYNISVTGEKLMVMKDFLTKVQDGYYGNKNSALTHELEFITKTILETSESMKVVLTK